VLPAAWQAMKAWLHAFAVMVAVPDRGFLLAEVLPIALTKGASGAASVQSRAVACALLGIVAPRLTREDVQKMCLKQVSKDGWGMGCFLGFKIG
jgi:hypothetical protein